MIVNNLVQRFKQLERRGNKKSFKKVQIDLSTSIGELAGPVHYRVVTPPPQPDRQDMPPVAEQPGKLPTKEQVPSSRPVEADGSEKFSFDLSVDPGDPINRPKVPLLKPMHDGSDLVGFTLGNPDYATNWADTPPKDVEESKQAEKPAVRLEFPVYTEVIEEVQDKNADITPAPIDPVNEPNYVGTKPKKGFEQKKKGIPSEQIRKKPAFEIYHDPPSPVHRRPLSQRLQTHHLEQGIENLRLGHDPLSHNVQQAPESRPYHGGYVPHIGHSHRRPLVHSTPKGRSDFTSSDASGYHQQGNRWKNPPGRPRHFDRVRGPHEPEYEENPNIDPYTMDDPAFPDRWRIPPGNVLQNWYKHWDLGKVVETFRSDCCL